MYAIPISQAAFCPSFLSNTCGFEGRREQNSFLIFWEKILSECRLLMRGEIKT
jgi:hypothetical protein